MTSLSSVLRQPTLAAERATVAVPDPFAIDPVVRASVERATTDAYERGFAEGMAAGRREAYNEAQELAELIRGAARDAAVRLAEARAARATEVVELALAIAEQVIGHEPHDGGMTLVERVRATLEQLDDEPLRVLVHPEDVSPVERGIVGARNVRVEADATLQPGEARVEGPWSRAELTFAGAMDIIREVLGA